MNCKDLWRIFENEGFNFFTGVPDSTFKSWMSFLESKDEEQFTNIIASNECEAVGIASGYHLSTGKIGVVYMQNAGLGKTVNPITSLVDKEVYSIPILLMIGWRGQPGMKDEPQHIKMGKITLPLLELLDIPYSILPEDKNSATDVIKNAKKDIVKTSSPFAIILKKGTLEPYLSESSEDKFQLNREDVIKSLLEYSRDFLIVSTTGKTSRELFENRINRNEKPRDFYTVGSMGCASAISLGIALNSSKKVMILDGDGSVLMQMGTLATIGHYKPNNLLHIIFDNQSHESTGGQPTVSSTVNFDKISLACGYKSVITIAQENDLKDFLSRINNLEYPCMAVIKTKKHSRADLGRPTTTPRQNKDCFMKYISEE